jgi:MFS family permease
MSPLRIPDFRRLWLAGLISDTGDWLLLVSLPILVYSYTGSALGTAFAFLVELAPPVLMAPLAGRIADRLDRARTLTVIALAQAALLTPLLLVDGRGGLPVIYAVIALQAALASVFGPTKNALLPTLVGRDQLVPANSLIGLNENLGRLVGGPLGGLLLVVGGGLPTIVAVDAASFVLAVALVAPIGRTRAASGIASSVRSAEAAGWRAALGPREIRGTLLVAFTASVAQGIFVVLFVLFVARSLHGGPAETGLLRGVQAVGSIAAGLLLATSRPLAPGRLTASAAAAFGLISLTVWNAPDLSTAVPLYIALFIAVGAPGIGLTTGLASAAQQATIEGQRGTAFAAVGVAVALGEAIGILAAGALGDPLGITTLLNAQGALYVIAAGLAARWMIAPGFRRPLIPSARPPASQPR